MTAYIGYILDFVILAVLAVTIIHARTLSKQFEATQADRRAFEQLIQSLNLAASRAESAIRSLKEAATESGDALQERVNKARALADELEIMVQAGDTLAERLGTLAEKSRKAATPEPTHEASAAARAAQPRSKAEKELIDALKAKQTT